MNVKTICDTIKKVAVGTSQRPFPAIPAIVLLCSLAKRPGLSTIVSVVNIVQAIKAKGIPTENNPDGTPNLIVQLIYSTVDEIYRAIREDSNGQTATSPGAITMSGTAYGPAGPMPFTGFNILPFKSFTLIS